MWRKAESESPSQSPENPSQAPSPPASSRKRGSTQAIIGPSISINGDVTGDEDLVIQGRVKGKVDLKQHHVTIGKEGRVEADIYGRHIQVEGHVQGNLFGDEQVVVLENGRVEGNITAPRVNLKDGCRFKGAIDMEPKQSVGGSGGGGRGDGSRGGGTGSDAKAKPGGSPSESGGRSSSGSAGASGGGASKPDAGAGSAKKGTS